MPFIDFNNAVGRGHCVSRHDSYTQKQMNHLRREQSRLCERSKCSHTNHFLELDRS